MRANTIPDGRQCLPATAGRFAQITAVSAFILLIAGGLVTSTGSGLSVPDWPLSFGKFFPKMVGGVAFEHGHRVIAGAVSLLTFSLTLWVRFQESRPWVRRMAYGASAAIILQALLGAATVLWRLPAAISIAHACLAQGVFCLLLALAEATSPQYRLLSSKGLPAGLWKTGAFGFCVVYLQLFWGALLRHTGEGLAFHVIWAFVVLGALAALVYKSAPIGIAIGAVPGLLRPAAGLAALLPLQLILGYLSYRNGLLSDFRSDWATAVVPTMHVASGALILGTCLIWTLRAYRAQ